MGISGKKRGGNNEARAPPNQTHTHTPFAFYLVVRVVTIYDSCLKAEETNGQLVNYLTRKKKFSKPLRLLLAPHQNNTKKPVRRVFGASVATVQAWKGKAPSRPAPTVMPAGTCRPKKSRGTCPTTAPVAMFFFHGSTGTVWFRVSNGSRAQRRSWRMRVPGVGQWQRFVFSETQFQKRKKVHGTGLQVANALLSLNLTQKKEQCVIVLYSWIIIA